MHFNLCFCFQPSEHVRIETGVRQGDEVSVHYDPMIAKLVNFPFFVFDLKVT